MNKRRIAPDDLQDVIEMTRSIENGIHKVIHESELNLGLSALMNATMNVILYQCRDKAEARFYRNAFVKMFDQTIRSIRIEED